MNIQDGFPLGLSGLISLLSKGLSRVSSINSLALSLLYGPTLTSIHDYWKNSFDYTDLVSKVMSLLFNTLSRFVIAFLLRSKHLLISWLRRELIKVNFFFFFSSWYLEKGMWCLNFVHPTVRHTWRLREGCSFRVSDI